MKVGRHERQCGDRRLRRSRCRHQQHLIAATATCASEAIGSNRRSVIPAAFPEIHPYDRIDLRAACAPETPRSKVEAGAVYGLDRVKHANRSVEEPLSIAPDLLHWKRFVLITFHAEERLEMPSTANRLRATLFQLRRQTVRMLE